MQFEKFPLELVSNFISIIVIIAIFYRFFQYKKKIEVIKGLESLSEENQLTHDDEEFIKTNHLEYHFQLQKQEALIKFIYPLFILIAGVFLLTFETAEAMIHLNILVVIFIYLHIVRIHLRNFVKFLEVLKQDIEKSHKEKEEEPTNE